MIQTPVITDFTAGEVSPKLTGRIDLAISSKGVGKMQNAYPLVQGGFHTRPGSKALGGTKSYGSARLIPFDIGPSAHFVLEMGEDYFRVWSAGAAVMDGSSPLEVVTPYSIEEVWKLHRQQVGNSLYLVCDTQPIQVVTYDPGTGAFAIAPLTIEFGSGVPAWADSTAYAVGDVVVNGSSAYECITAGTSAGSGGPTGTGADITDGGAHWRFLNAKPFSATGDYPSTICHFGGRMWYAGSVNDPQGAWGSTPFDYGNFDFFELTTYTLTSLVDAALWADPLVPETEDIVTTQLVYGDADAIYLQIASEKSDSIRWLIGSDALIIGTSTSEWVVPADVTALNVSAKRMSGFGSDLLQAEMLGDSPVFVQGSSSLVTSLTDNSAVARSTWVNPSRTALREYAYRNESAELASPDLAVLADHILSAGVKQVAVSRMPQPGLYLVLGDGDLAFLTYDKQHEVRAWCTFTSENPLNMGTTNASPFASVAVVGRDGSSNDAVYVIHRILLDTSRNVVSMLDEPWDFLGYPLDAYHQYDNITFTTPSSPFQYYRKFAVDPWFNEQTVVAMKTDGTLLSVAVDDGYALVAPASAGVPAVVNGDDIVIGLPMRWLVTTLPITATDQPGGGIGLPQRVTAIRARVYMSYPFYAFSDVNDTQNIAHAADDRVDLTWALTRGSATLTGDVTCAIDAYWNHNGTISLYGSDPFPVTVLAIALDVDQ